MMGGGNMKDNKKYMISSELVAAYLDGRATREECLQILSAAQVDVELRELLEIAMAVDVDLQEDNVVELLPMTAMAATEATANMCVWMCEKYILEKLGVPFDEKEAVAEMQHNGWLKDGGVNLFNVGRYSETLGLSVRRIYDGTLSDLEDALREGSGVIAVVDCGELIGGCIDEKCEDALVGNRPDHAVVVLSCDREAGEVEIYDPNSSAEIIKCTIDTFVNAWADSKKYYVTLNYKTMSTYNPKPIDLSDVVLDEDLSELREAIAENAHEIWAVERQSKGWTWGPKRDDEKKHNPCMVPYSDLSEDEKLYDREMAMQTIKLLKKLGYDLVKREETDLYDTLLRRLRYSTQTFLCPECNKRGKKTSVYKYQAFCDVCGHELTDVDWTIYDEF